MTMVVFVFQGQVGGLFSAEYVAAPWSWNKLLDLLSHLWIPVLIVGTAGAASNIRIVRGNLLDVLGQPYVQTARAKGQAERFVIYRHALRNSLHPLIMRIGSSLPSLIAGEIIVSIVLGLPTAGKTFYDALMYQDTYLAGSFLVMLAVLLQIGNLLADIALIRIDPTISYD
jgi:peptide/nickel transport system permease protein